MKTNAELNNNEIPAVNGGHGECICLDGKNPEYIILVSSFYDIIQCCSHCCEAKPNNKYNWITSRTTEEQAQEFFKCTDPVPTKFPLSPVIFPKFSTISWYYPR